jgi:hypothetical protein
MGGGASIKEGLSLGLKEKIMDRFVITCNFSFLHFDSVFNTFLDKRFYEGKIDKASPEIIDNEFLSKLKSFPLLIGGYSKKFKEIYPNTILLKLDEKINHKEKSLERGFYRGNLTGIFALSVASYLLNYNGTIFLSGFDSGTKDMRQNSKPETHYYSDKEINHGGQHKTSVYKTTDPNKHFSKFLDPNLKIYNVNPNSNINTFKKIDYPTFFSLLDNVVYDLEGLREEVRRKLCTK